MNITELQNQIEQEREKARAICSINGATSPECAAAWDAVEELQAAVAHLNQASETHNVGKYSNGNANHGNAASKQEILRLGAMGDEKVVSELCKILENDSDPEIRAAAAQAIGMIAEEVS
jgi:hypothetical protein